MEKQTAVKVKEGEVLRVRETMGRKRRARWTRV